MEHSIRDITQYDSKKLVHRNSAKLRPVGLPLGRKYWMRLLSEKQNRTISRVRMNFIYLLL